jgi:tRNA dimethylallyltransferase
MKQGKSDNKRVIIIMGPTAIGKTKVALTLAEQFHTSIISADSRQCFKELNIGVAKPSKEELAQIPHYFINSHSIHDEVNAAIFEKLAMEAVDKIFEEKDIAIMVGGTGLYIRAFCEGLDAIPPVDPLLRLEIQHKYASLGLEWLQEETKKNDPAYYGTAEIQNPQRLMRALEVKLSTDRSIMTFHSKAIKNRAFDIKKIGLQLQRNELYKKINERTDRMMGNGLLEEARGLLGSRHLNSLQTVGYPELFDFIDGKTSLENAVERIKQHTRLYAKRQMTWFGKDQSIEWISPTNWEQLKKITQS